jgi:hypothetical protein
MKITAHCTWLLTAAMTVAAATLTGCSQGRPSAETPIHLNPNMDHVARYNTQSESSFYADGAAMRPPVEGTVARGKLKELSQEADVLPFGVTLTGPAVGEFYTGKNAADGSFVAHSPIPFTMDVLRRGHDRFEIFCAPCHGRAGDGQGLVVTRKVGLIPPPSYHDERLVAVGDGELFSAMTNGIRTMPSYAAQIPVADRWAIVGYIRALQNSQRATLDDLPPSERQKLAP